VVPPTELVLPSPDIPIVVCSQLSKNAIVERIRALGFKNPLITLEV